MSKILSLKTEIPDADELTEALLCYVSVPEDSGYVDLGIQLQTGSWVIEGQLDHKPPRTW